MKQPTFASMGPSRGGWQRTIFLQGNKSMSSFILKTVQIGFMESNFISAYVLLWRPIKTKKIQTTKKWKWQNIYVLLFCTGTPGTSSARELEEPQSIARLFASTSRRCKINTVSSTAPVSSINCSSTSTNILFNSNTAVEENSGRRTNGHSMEFHPVYLDCRQSVAAENDMDYCCTFPCSPLNANAVGLRWWL